MAQENKRNDKIQEKVESLGFCCLYYFFHVHTGHPWSHKKIAIKLGLSRGAIMFNRKKLKTGEVVCKHKDECKLKGECK